MPRHVALTINVPVDLHSFLAERVEQLNRHVAVLQGPPKDPLKVEDALVELIAAWRDQVDPDQHALAQAPSWG